MHRYAPNFEEVEGANRFGHVRLSIHLPSPPPPTPIFLEIKFEFFVNNI